MKPQFRLTLSTDFKRVRSSGKSYAHPLVVLVSAPNESCRVRIGITTSSAVGNAVKRNRARRQIRACLDGVLPQISAGWDIIIIARRAICLAKFEEICSAIRHSLQRARLLESGTASGWQVGISQ